MSPHPLTDRPEIFFDRLGGIDYDAVREHMHEAARRVLDGYGGQGEQWRQTDKDQVIRDVCHRVFYEFERHHKHAMWEAFRAALADAEQAADQDAAQIDGPS